MKFTTFMLIAYFASFCVSVIAKDVAVKSLSEAEATAIVMAQEKSKERAKDSHEAKLKSAKIIETSVANLGSRKVIFNRIKAFSPSTTNQIDRPTNSNEDTMPAKVFHRSLENEKKHITFTLSGTLYDNTISEIWWDYNGQHYRIFSNANFMLFNGIGEFSDDEANYSVLSIVSGTNSDGLSNSEEWRPTTEDFSQDALEYYVVEWGDSDFPDKEALKGILAMLKYYARNFETMQIRYENSKKMRAARQAYLETNPPKKRDTIINFTPTGKSADLYK